MTPPELPEHEAERVELLARRVKAKGWVFQRVMGRVWQADPDLYRAVLSHVDSCDPYLMKLWARFFDGADAVARLKRDSGVIECVSRELAIIEVIAELRPPETPWVEATSGLSVRHNLADELRTVVAWSVRSGASGSLSLDQLRAIVLAVWILDRFSEGPRPDGIVSLRPEAANIDYLAVNFAAAMKKREVLRRRGSIDRVVVAEALGAAPAALAEGLL